MKNTQPTEPTRKHPTKRRRRLTAPKSVTFYDHHARFQITIYTWQPRSPVICGEIRRISPHRLGADAIPSDILDPLLDENLVLEPGEVLTLVDAMPVFDQSSRRFVLLPRAKTLTFRVDECFSFLACASHVQRKLRIWGFSEDVHIDSYSFRINWFRTTLRPP